MTSRLRSFLVLLAVWLAGATSPSAQVQESDQQVLIRGTVENSVTHAPIARAQVYTQDNRHATMTDDQGHFEFSFVPQNKEQVFMNGQPLLARKPGFLSNRDDLVQFAGQASGASEIMLSLVPEAILMGRITLDNQDSADGIQVQLYRREISDGLAHWIPQNIFMTNSKGEYRFAELYAGDYRVGTQEAADRDPEDTVPGGKVFGFPPVYFPEASFFQSAATVHLSPGKVSEEDILLARRQYYPVKISVGGGPGMGVPANVTVSVEGDGAPGYSLGYNPKTQTISGSLPNGSYAVELFAFSQPGASGGTDVRVADRPSQTGHLTLLPNPTIDVAVREEFTNPVPNNSGLQTGIRRRGRDRYLNVNLEPISDFGQGRGASLRPPRGTSGQSLAIDNVNPGKYWVDVTSMRGYVQSVTSSGVDLQHQPLIVESGSSSPIEIVVRDDAASFDGKIEDANASLQNPASSGDAGSAPGPYIPSAYIYCIPLPNSSGQFNQTQASPDGTFNSPDLPPGEYRILAFKHRQNELEYRNAEAMRAFESKGLVVRLVAGEKQHLQLTLISTTGQDEN